MTSQAETELQTQRVSRWLPEGSEYRQKHGKEVKRYQLLAAKSEYVMYNMENTVNEFVKSLYGDTL